MNNKATYFDSFLMIFDELNAETATAVPAAAITTLGILTTGILLFA